MVAISVLAVLLALAVPVLSRARDAARQLQCVANLSSIGKTVELWAMRHRGVFPWVRGGDGTYYPYGSHAPPGTGATIPQPYSLAIQWPLIVQDVAPWEEHYASWICPGSPRVKDSPWIIDSSKPSYDPSRMYVMTSYAYSHSFVADPKRWSPNGPPLSAAEAIRPVLLSEALHPSLKVMFFDVEYSHLSQRAFRRRDAAPLLFADAHAGVRTLSEARRPYRFPSGTGRLFHDTIDGVRGRDY